jgi:hypothetical protein
MKRKIDEINLKEFFECVAELKMRFLFEFVKFSRSLNAASNRKYLNYKNFYVTWVKRQKDTEKKKNGRR